PTAPFAPATAQRLTVGTEARDRAGNALAAPLTVDFTTQAGGSPNGSDNPALSCADLQRRGGGAASGRYWLRRSCAGTAFAAYCDQVTDGGGWMLVLAYGHATGTHADLNDT